MNDVIFLFSMVWGAVMTGLMFYYKERANERTIMCVAMMHSIKGIAEGDIRAYIDMQGNIKVEEVKDGLQK
jgi:signal transduction histidine kinase